MKKLLIVALIVLKVSTLPALAEEHKSHDVDATAVNSLALPAIALSAQEVESHTDCDNNEYESFSELNYAPDWAKRNGWYALPILFATDRSLLRRGTCNCFSEEQAQDTKDKGLFYGRKTVFAPRLNVFSDPKYNAFFDTLGWQLEQKYFRGKQINTPALQNLKLTKSEFLDQLSSLKQTTQAAIDKLPAGRKEERFNDLCVFVHGCCRSFDLHTEHAAYLNSWLCRPVVSYDWTAPHVTLDVTKYLGNEINVQRSQDRFDRFLASIESIYPPEKTILIAHSMGNRLIEEALIRRAYQKKRPYKEVIFGCADTDLGAFANHVGLICDAAQQVTIYTSMHDKLLALSAAVHSKQHRLGRMNLAESKDLLNASNKKNIRIFDVTELDINHDLPIWLVANLYQQNDPRTGGKFSIQMPTENLFVFKEDSGFKPSIEVSSTELSGKQPELLNIYQRQLSNTWVNQKPFTEPMMLSININSDGSTTVVGADSPRDQVESLEYAKKIILESGPLTPPAEKLNKPIQVLFSGGNQNNLEQPPQNSSLSPKSSEFTPNNSIHRNPYRFPSGLKSPPNYAYPTSKFSYPYQSPSWSLSEPSYMFRPAESPVRAPSTLNWEQRYHTNQFVNPYLRHLAR
jgi:hypothetical protein